MVTTDITQTILAAIQQAIVHVTARIDALGVRLESVRDELKHDIADVHEKLGKKLDQTNRYVLSMESRIAIEISALRAEIDDLRTQRAPV